MKKLILGFFAALFIFTSCDFSTPEEDKGTKLVVSNWADNVYSVYLVSNEQTAGVKSTKTGSSYAGKTITGSVTLKISYKELTDAEKETYLGYGILDGSSNLFKVFVNGSEVQNMHVKASVPHGDNELPENILYLNANVDYFEYTFNLNKDEKAVTVAFENSPTLIPYNSLRLVNESSYAYVDVSNLEELFDGVKVWNAEGYPFNRIPKWYYILDKNIAASNYTQGTNFQYDFFVTFKKKTGTFSDSDTFTVTGAASNNIQIAHKSLTDSDRQCNLFIYLNSKPYISGSVLHINIPQN